LAFEKSLHQFTWQNIDFLLIQLPKNSGPSNARNIAMQALDGKVDVIAIADADDIYYPEKINKSVEIMKKYPEVALVYTDYDIEDVKAGTKKREYKEPFSYKRLFQECIVSNNSIFALSAAKQVGGYDITLRYGEDYDLWLRIADIGSLYHIPEALYNYRLTGNNVTVVTPPEQFAQHVNRVHEKALERRSRRAG
jgi:glycosyltransferase involved in cell wall biosynthesis